MIQMFTFYKSYKSMPCIFSLQTVHSVLKSLSTGKYFPHDEMFKVDNLFWQKCKEKICQDILDALKSLLNYCSVHT